jgi:pSer/pThr/pTyr-binding forkhead associated (FHA) protein
MTGVVVLILRVLMVVALYAFLGTALWIMWRQLAQSTERAGNRKVPRIHLEVKQAGQPAATRAFAQPEVILGRDPLSDLPLADAAVSSRHALLSYHSGQWWIQDLGSRNGTRLNSAAVTLPTVLADGDELRCGDTFVSVVLAEGRAAGESILPGGPDE